MKRVSFNDSKINLICSKVDLPALPKSNDIYLDLLEVIISQQLSGHVAKVIFNRFLELFEGRYPKPDALSKMDIATLRRVGLSQSKSNYVMNLAVFALANDLTVNHFDSLSDDEVLKYLTQVKGIGKWSVEMILIFSLQRPDVFPYDDLVIKKSMIDIYNIKKEGKELLKEMNLIANRWKPNRSLASRYLWANYGLTKSKKSN